MKCKRAHCLVVIFVSFQINTCFVWRFKSLHTIPLCRLKLPKAYTDLTTYVTWTAIRFKEIVDLTISFKLPSYAPIYCHKSHWQMLIFVENDILSKLCLFLCVVSNYQKTFERVVDFTISFKLPSYAPIYCHKSHWQIWMFVYRNWCFI